MTSSNADASLKPPRRRLPAFFLLWITLIFVTSCTVIRPAEFFAMIHRTTGADEAWMERFTIFWGICWYTVVKGWHFTEFVILTLLCVHALKWWYGTVSTTTVLAAMTFCVLFAISDEWHQSFIPQRFGTVQDVLIDCLGVGVTGGLLLSRLRKEEMVSNSSDGQQ